MEASSLGMPRPEADVIECWDDDEDIQCTEDIRFRTASTATSVTGFSGAASRGHRDSMSSRRSYKSDLDSNLDDDESWQLLLQDNDDFSTQDAISSAKSAGIPIPEDIPKSALLGGTIKRLGAKKSKRALADDWSEDLDFGDLNGNLEVKLCEETAPPDSLMQLNFSPTSSPTTRRDGFQIHLGNSPPPQRPITDALERFKDTDEDASFMDVPTIKIAKSRLSTNPFVSPPPEPSPEDDSFEKDIEFPAEDEPLRLAPRADVLRTPDPFSDDFDAEWAEGSIGIRSGGTRREERSNRSSTISMLSPSISSCLTAESDDEDALEGLELPDLPLDLGGSLQKRLQSAVTKENAEPSEKHQPSTQKQAVAPESDDFFSGIEIGDRDIFDPAKLSLNRNIKQKSARPPTPAKRSSTTITFANKSTRIPRLSGHERPLSTHLEPVSESGAPVSKFHRGAPRSSGHNTRSSLSNISHMTTTPISNFSSRQTLGKRRSRENLRAEASTPNSQFLRSKRSAPAMRSINHSSVLSQRSPPTPRHEISSRPTHSTRPRTPNDWPVVESRAGSSRRPQGPFLPTGGAQLRSHHITIRTGRHNRSIDSQSSCDSQNPRSHSRLSNPNQPDSPGRIGQDQPHHPPSAAAGKQTVTKPTRRRNFGDGTELDIFDDLPTSATLESNFIKAPVGRGVPRAARNRLSQSNIVAPRTGTPAPTSPMSPCRPDFTPRFARDTNASRIAREQRLGQREREATPLAPLSTNWRTQAVPRSLNSPGPSKSKSRRGSKDVLKPHLIKPMGTGVQEPKSVKGMKYNPTLYKWEGNENATVGFEAPPAPQTPKPALISNVGGIGGTQIVGSMVFDPQKMAWHKLPSSPTGKTGVTPAAEDDVFAGIQDLDDRPQRSAAPSRGDPLDDDWGAGDTGNQDDRSGEDSSDEWPITEEFDVGPEFIRRQRAEEEKWRRKVSKWVSEDRSKLGDGWRWAIRDLARPDLAFKAHPRFDSTFRPSIL